MYIISKIPQRKFQNTFNEELFEKEGHFCSKVVDIFIKESLFDLSYKEPGQF